MKGVERAAPLGLSVLLTAFLAYSQQPPVPVPELERLKGNRGLVELEQRLNPELHSQAQVA